MSAAAGGSGDAGRLQKRGRAGRQQQRSSKHPPVDKCADSQSICCGDATPLAASSARLIAFLRAAKRARRRCAVVAQRKRLRFRSFRLRGISSQSARRDASSQPPFPAVDFR
ncbi:hypothetical protein Bcep1808_0107 [Burkholderia vietnamiensis G4]|uniref:Uncharacterized protein n=1 Tax=Burkholderia vietnamiensis (strain G4 / LMG 22486) TaxID=269482 RepID=A4JA27_BURVG|nr:hypothetical protein Bcep1808_0107 [Burkholderia vietnamiensis G4]